MSAPDSSEQVQKLLDEVETLYRSHQERAFVLGQQALADALVAVPGDAHQIARALYYLAHITERRGQHRESLQYLYDALPVLEDEGIDAPDLLCAVYNLLGWNHLHIGQHIAGVEYALKQRTAADRASTPDFVRARASNLLGALYGEQPQGADTAVGHYQHSLALFRQLDDAHYQARVLNNLCAVYTNTGDHDNALHYGKAALTLTRQLGNTHIEVEVLGNMATLFQRMQQFPKALAYLHFLVDLCREYKYGHLETQANLSLGRLHFEADELALAESHLNTALAHSVQNPKARATAHELLSAVYEKRGDPAAALVAYKRFHESRVRALDERTRLKVENLQLAHEMDKVRTELDGERERYARSQEAFERISRLQRSVISHASHDLKNPLTSLMLQVDLIERVVSEPSDRLRTLVARMRENVHNMQKLIVQLLDKAMLEQDDTLDLTDVDVGALLAASLAAMTDAAEARSIGLEAQVEAGVVYAAMDRDRMARVMGNLLSNAVKYTPEGGRVTVGCSTHEDGAVTLFIADTGIGIPKLAMPRLFEPFYRVDKATHRQAEGNGLGLSIVKTIVGLHNGTLRVESAENVGTTFYIDLPPARLTPRSTARLG